MTPSRLGGSYKKLEADFFAMRKPSHPDLDLRTERRFQLTLITFNTAVFSCFNIFSGHFIWSSTDIILTRWANTIFPQNQVNENQVRKLE